MEATDDAFRERYPLREGLALYQCISLFVGGSERKNIRNIPLPPVFPRSRNDFFRLLESDARVIHVSCHGNSDGLTLRKRTKFEYDEFLDVDFSSRARLLFVNACEVAKGPATLAALASLCQGSRKERYVIAPSNEVSFETALIFAIHFYRLLLARRMSIVKAFKRATVLLGDFADLEYVCLDALRMKEYSASRGQTTERRLRC